MKQFLFYCSIATFSIFIGSQITEGALLVPYWQSLATRDFYAYYQQFGPSISRFYTVLTIVAALIPVLVSIYCKTFHPRAFRTALISSFFAVLFIACFYVYFKGTNALFYQEAFSEVALQKELVTWSYWHGGRILMEFASLVFLIRTFMKIQDP